MGIMFQMIVNSFLIVKIHATEKEKHSKIVYANILNISISINIKKSFKNKININFL